MPNYTVAGKPEPLNFNKLSDNDKAKCHAIIVEVASS